MREPKVDPVVAARLIRPFWRDGRILRWPAREGRLRMVLAEVAQVFPFGTRLPEEEVDVVLGGIWPDYCQLRRALATTNFWPAKTGATGESVSRLVTQLLVCPLAPSMGLKCHRLALPWLLTLLAVTSACGGTRSLSQGAASLSPAPTTAASPTATPLAVAVKPSPQDYGHPPAGVDLFYVTVPGWPTHLVGYDWLGNPRATVHLKELDGYAPTNPGGISIAPNGQAFESGAYTFDRLGQVVYQHEPTEKGLTVRTWSDDGAMLCGVEEQFPNNGTAGTDYYLVRRVPSGPAGQGRALLARRLDPG